MKDKLRNFNFYLIVILEVENKENWGKEIFKEKFF